MEISESKEQETVKIEEIYDEFQIGGSIMSITNLDLISKSRLCCDLCSNISTALGSLYDQYIAVCKYIFSIS